MHPLALALHLPTLQAELCGLRMQLVNLKRSALPSFHESELQQLLAKQQDVNRGLQSMCSEAQQRQEQQQQQEVMPGVSFLHQYEYASVAACIRELPY